MNPPAFGPAADEEQSPLSAVLDLLSTDEQRRTRIAWLYYVEGLTQAEIAERLAVSRVKVVRDLQIGRQTGLVQIQISGRLASCVALERALERRFGLRQAVVVPRTTPRTCRRPWAWHSEPGSPTGWRLARRWASVGGGHCIGACAPCVAAMCRG